MQWKMRGKMASLSASLCFQLISVFALGFLLLAPVDATIASVNRSEEVHALLNFRGANVWYETVHYWNSWNETDATPCSWFGVTCTANYTVAELDFSGWGLTVYDVDALYNLGDIHRLDMSSNNLQHISDEIDGTGKLSRLTHLDLSATGLTGQPLQSISACHNLRFLALETNDISTLPPGMSDLVNLQFLSLANNSLSGPFPTEELGNLGSLVSLDLSGNSFNGSIPSLANLASLLVLKLDNNYFTEFERPLFIGPQSLQQLSISNNHLEGTIPSTIAKLENLTLLDMSGNNLSGEIPTEFNRLLNVNRDSIVSPTLDLSQNQLTGRIPTDILALAQKWYGTTCATLNLSHNLLTGNIPIHGDNAYSSCFTALDFSYNNLSGPVPSNIFSNAFGSVYSLCLNDNQLSGDIVDTFLIHAFHGWLTDLRMANNLFAGDLSRLANISLVGSAPAAAVRVVDLSNNRLQWRTSEAIPDPITTTLEALTSTYAAAGTFSAFEYRFGGNNFSGTSLPTSCFVNSAVKELFSALDLSNSQLQGEIFGAAFNSTCLPSIQLLNLSNNHATGPLPQSIVGENQAFIIDVSNNDLSGHLPVIPQSRDQYNPKYFAGNGALCGDPLPPCAHGVQWWVLLIIIGVSVTIAMGSCLAATWRWRVYNKQHQQDADLIRTLLERDLATLMPLRELKKATSNFAETAQIGQGGFGTVYMGRLNDGTLVAIKRSKREGSEQDKQQFLNEVRILSQVNHRNLVKLLGCSMENKVAVLVFEFISNGTLQEHLQGKTGAICLTWKQRLNIAVQIADALNYLHSMASCPVYHRDVKSANILLDDKLNAKVADFGISKLAPLQATHVSTVAIQGTMGYMDPEYYTSYQLTDKSDVYSFGVVLLELISAKPALDFQRGGDETSLVYFARPYIEKGELEEIIDPALRETYGDQVGNGRESILTVGQLAMKCLDMRSKARPSMNGAFKELQNFWAQLNTTSESLEDYINEHDNEDVECGQRVLPSNYSFEGSSTFVTQSDASGIQMSQFSDRQTLRLRSIH